MRTLKSLQVGMITIALLGGLGGAGLSQEGEAQPDPVAATEANEAASLDAFLAQDLDAFMATFTDDAAFEDQTFGDDLKGAPAVRGMFESVLGFTDPATTEILDRFVSLDGSRAVIVMRWTGTSAFGRAFDLPMVVLHEYRDGRIAKESLYYAAKDAYAQLMEPLPAE